MIVSIVFVWSVAPGSWWVLAMEISSDVLLVLIGRCVDVGRVGLRVVLSGCSALGGLVMMSTLQRQRIERVHTRDKIRSL